MNIRSSLMACTLCGLAGALGAQTVARQALTLDGAKRVAAAAIAYATEHQATGVVAIVDAGGQPMYLERIDGTFAAGAMISIGKARTAALFQKPTRVFEDIVKNGRTAMVALPDFTPLQGGVPLVVGDQIVGAIGVSGASSAKQDEEVALAGAAALQQPQLQDCCAVTYFDRATVEAAFAKGQPLLEPPAQNFKIHASRREQPGRAEVHATETDVIYVLGGAATMVTGGTVVGGERVAPDEVRGSAIEGGQSRELRAGDVLVVPKGTPHWFRRVEAPFTYYVVKVS
ncbi:MAG: heme-binding protein [Planctomycetota bacterium]